MFTNVYDRILPAPNPAGYGYVMKGFVEQIVADIPFLSIDTVVEDTSTNYQAIINYSFNSDVQIQLGNDSTQAGNFEVRAIINGQDVGGTSTHKDSYSKSFNNNSVLKLKIFVGENVAVVIWAVGATATEYDRNFLTFAKVTDFYSSNESVIMPGFVRMDYSHRFAGILNKNNYISYADIWCTLPPPQGVWDSSTNMYSAVPFYVYGGSTNTTGPVSGRIENSDCIYLLYKNNSATYSYGWGEIVINGHTFYCLGNDESNCRILCRIS